MGGIGDFAFFALIYGYLKGEIDTFGLDLMGRMMTWASGMALVLVSLWVLWIGYRILTGQYREPLMALVVRGLQVTLIVGTATGMSLLGTDLHGFFTQDLDREIHALFTGEQDKTAADSIDQNLAYMQLALGAIDAVQVLDGNDEAREQKSRALMFAGFGTGGPPMAAGAMLILFQFFVAMFVGLGPLFILCLLFDQTKELFRKWLLYGIGTLFSMAMLSVVTAMTMKLAAKVAVAMWASKAVMGVIPGADVEGLSSLALQQGGIGLLLTTAIVTVPPVAAAFFAGTMGHFMHFSAFAGGAASNPGPQGQPPGSYGLPSASTNPSMPATARDPGVFAGLRTMTNSEPSQPDQIRTRS
ncbi:type IV secretion system protein [Lysobacter sp. M2-1]|uniref:type IV secretion system protein n=1 Tax=Lysobacter sp. M2-1 TaxID=2916839 RepID=UPI001F55C48A|nr:type IV secretion system protein [Lysobacter sp. M2-1]